MEFMNPESMPGVFFSFDISPMVVIYTENKKAFAHFLTDGMKLKILFFVIHAL